MLVLLRDINDTVVIGKPGDVLTEPIIVTVVALRSNGARLGVTAQRDIAVHRSEVYEAIRRDHQRGDGGQHADDR